MIGLVIAFPQIVMVYKAGEKKLDLKQIQIIVPEEQPLGPGGAGKGAQPSPGGQEQEDAEKALEKAFGGEPSAPDQKGETKAPDTPAGTSAPAAGGASPPAADDDPTKALERALRDQLPDAQKAPAAPAQK